MRVALFSLGVLVVAAIIGAFIKPNPDQTRPLEPEAGGGGGAHDHH